MTDLASTAASHDVTEMLCREYGPKLSRAAVIDMVQAAHRDLQGQVHDDARLEMVYRLARHRLSG